MEFFKDLKKGTTLKALLIMAIGLVLLLYPAIATKTIAYVLSGIFVVIGVIYIIGYFRKSQASGDANSYTYGLVIGMLCIIFAVLISKVLMSLIPIILGLIVTFSGLVKLQQAIELKRFKEGNWIMIMVFALICIAAGLFAVFNPFSMINGLIRIIGAGLIFGGLTDIISTRYADKKLRKEEDRENNVVDVQ